MRARTLQGLKNPLWVLKTMSRNHLNFVSSAERLTVEVVTPYTLLGVARLRSLWMLAHLVLSERTPGSFVECGCWNGGSGALLAKVASADERKTWLFDSFEGLPAPSSRDVTGWGELGKAGDFVGTEANVREVLGLTGVPNGAVQIVKGWFEDTLKSTHTGPIALLHVDVDWHDSAVTVLDTLYDRIAAGGILIIDDYGFWQGLREAVDSFVAKHHLTVNQGAYPGVWIRKPK
jgi:O-methyltransferase